MQYHERLTFVVRTIALCAVALLLSCVAIAAHAEEVTYTVICQPDSGVSVRTSPNGQDMGCYLTLGDTITVDKHKSGFAHAIDLHFEDTEGWVSEKYLVEGEITLYEGGTDAVIVGKGRVRARKYPNGELRKWVYPDDGITVYAECGGWCVTNVGYVKAECVRFE